LFTKDEFNRAVDLSSGFGGDQHLRSRIENILWCKVPLSAISGLGFKPLPSELLLSRV